MATPRALITGITGQDGSYLTEQLLADWHECHEDIVFTLGLLGDPRAVEAISKAILIPFDSLVKWNNLCEFQRKCAYALARIGTEKSRAALELLTKHPDPQLREFGKEGLEHWSSRINADEGRQTD